MVLLNMIEAPLREVLIPSDTIIKVDISVMAERGGVPGSEALQSVIFNAHKKSS